jgi:hypothetical protein
MIYRSRSEGSLSHLRVFGLCTLLVAMILPALLEVLHLEESASMLSE